MIKATLNIDAIADASIPLVKLQEGIATEFDEDVYIDADGDAIEESKLEKKTFCIDNMDIANDRKVIFSEGILNIENTILDNSIPISKINMTWEYITE
jgi:hypothetical protein